MHSRGRMRWRRRQGWRSPMVAGGSGRRRLAALSAGAALVIACTASAAMGDWPTAHGNPQRTGCVDGKAGPKEPVVLWAHSAQEHYVASPVIDGGRIFIAGLGAFNTGVFHAIDDSPRSEKRVLWSAGAPFVKRPTVCSPAVGGGLVVFGDGMHQTDDAILYGLDAVSGLPLLRLEVPGKLIHLEAGPTISEGRIFTGGGDAGLLCIDAARVTLEGQEMDLATAKDAIGKKWDELKAKYAKDREKDAFAVPPSPESLPKAAAKLLWQVGKGEWHVDAPVAVVGSRVVVASAFLDEEKVGKRALICLNNKDGSPRWETPLEINPWAGATASDDGKGGRLVLVGCSSERFDPKMVKDAKGEVVAVNLQDGKVRWRRSCGGVLSCVAAAEGLAVFGATDGKLTACSLDSGEVRWSVDCGAAFLGGPAVAAGVAYAADIRGMLHAVRLADGKKLWTMDVLGDKAVLAPGMVFGSPVVHEGRIYLTSCNVLSKQTDLPSALVCIADKSEIAEMAAALKVEVDKEAGRVIVPCRIAPRKLPNLNEIYPIEVIATYRSPRGQKAHETVVTFEVTPSEVHKAMESLGLKAGTPAKGATNVASGPQVRILLALPAGDGPPRMVPIERTMVDRRSGKPLPPLKWLFTGSATRAGATEKSPPIYGADAAGTLISLFPVTDETVFQSALTMREEGMLKLDTNLKLLPAEGTAAKLVIETRLRPEGPASVEAEAPFVAANPLPAAPEASMPDVYALGSSSLRLGLARVQAPALEMLRGELLRPLTMRGDGEDLPLAAPAWSTRAARRQLAVLPPPRVEGGAMVRLGLVSGGSAYDAGEGPGASEPEPAQDAASKARAAAKDVVAPLLRLRIPDPFETQNAVGLGELPRDDAPPAEPKRLELARPVLAVPATQPATQPAANPPTQPPASPAASPATRPSTSPAGK